MTHATDPPTTQPAWPTVWGEGLHSRTALLFWLAFKSQNDRDAQALVAAFEADIFDIAHHLNDLLLGNGPEPSEDYVRGWNEANAALYGKLGARVDELRHLVFEWSSRRGDQLAQDAPFTWRSTAITAGELLHAVLPLYTELAGPRPFDVELTTVALTALAPAIADDGPAYTTRLRAFTDAHRDRIQALLDGYGPGSSHDRPGGRLQLVRQPELLAVLERLHAEPVSLIGVFEDCPPETLPDTLLYDLTAAWGIRLPERH
ncbi:hypothetical protein ACGF12_13880 [Kitasatospora sp. NPDC048296]|uniref:hypothetical protein n=1 Tax=Kitasatospora sp. NPDC048296 TaxID=3364048 RepID=UPI00371ECEBE